MTRVLKVDYDYWPGEEWLRLWLRTRVEMLERLGYEVEGHRVVRTKRGFHAYIRLKRRVGPRTANMLQFLLGDDATRVRINEWRISRGVRHWNKLFGEVLYRRKRPVVVCRYCGNVVPLPPREGRLREVAAMLERIVEEAEDMVRNADALVGAAAVEHHASYVIEWALRALKALGELLHGR